MKTKALTLIVAGLLILPLTACRVEQTQEGELPEVEVEGGQLPEYDVDPAEVEIGTEKKEITVPDIDVTMPDEEEEEDEPPVH